MTIKQSRSSASETYDLLLAEIESGGLPPGARLVEAELAARFSISRTPIRETLKRLELQGIVMHEPHHGAVVASLDYAQIVELYLLREVLEGTAARLAAQHASDVEIEILQAMVQNDRKRIDDAPQLARTNRAFHQQIRDSARNRFLANALENMRLSLVLLAGSTLGAPGRGQTSIDEHALIVERIAAHDCAGAEEAARQHIRNAFKTRISLQQK